MGTDGEFQEDMVSTEDEERTIFLRGLRSAGAEKKRGQRDPAEVLLNENVLDSRPDDVDCSRDGADY